jgi:hypothetical protein
MGITIHLPGTVARMILHMDDESRGWCRCFISNRGEHFIGGQAADYVLTHLLQALEDPLINPVGEIDGLRVSWVLSLSSPHVSIYSAEVDRDRWLFFQNAEAVITGIIILAPEQQEIWKSQLKLQEPRSSHHGE